jgi:hypothetical protein
VAHLGDDVAAFVDGQLSPDAMRAVESHLEGCATCRQAVAQQRLLKSRMRGAGHLEPPPQLVASLSTLPHSSTTEPHHRAWWSRLLGSTSLGVGFVLLGASMAVVAVAYVVGPADDTADQVSPPFDRFAAEYTTGGPAPSGSLTIPVMAELDEYGWPCHDRLGGGLARVAGHYQDGQETVALVYSDGYDALSLFEQGGALDPGAVARFDRRMLAKRQVWVREGRPRIVTWAADGIVFTIVTELGDHRLAQALADLPRSAPQPDPVERIGDGLNRMTTWVGVGA